MKAEDVTAEVVRRLLDAEDAARRYVAARYRLRGADTAGVVAAAVEVDTAWHRLTIAVGAHDRDCPDCPDADA